MIAKLFENGAAFQPTIMPIGNGGFRPTPGNNSDPKYRPPMPGQPGFDGDIQNGLSYKFDNTSLGVVDQNGHAGISNSNAREHAFLQLLL
jgi:hypothetical protein